MDEQEFTTPDVVNVKKLTTEIGELKEYMRRIVDKQTPQMTPTAEDEELGTSTEDPYHSYKQELIEFLNDHWNDGTELQGKFPNKGSTIRQFQEAVGAKEIKIENKGVVIDDYKDPQHVPQTFQEAIGAASAGSAVPEIWAKDVFRCCPYPASAFWGAPYIKWHDDIRGKAGDTIHVVTVGRATCGTAGCAEPVGAAPTIGAVAITLEEYQCSMYVCRDDLEDMIPDTITELNNALAECIDICIDNAFIANIIGLGSTLDKGTAVITAADIAEAIGTMRSGTCEPVVFIIHPAVESRLMRDSQFVNAATFGDRSVITGGHIISYLGLDIVVVPKGSLVIDAPGTYASLMLSRYAVHAAMKREPSMETQYLVQTQRKYLYASVRFGKSVVCNDGVLWVRTGA